MKHCKGDRIQTSSRPIILPPFEGGFVIYINPGVKTPAESSSPFGTKRVPRTCTLFRERVPFVNSAIRSRSISLLFSQATTGFVLG